MRKHLTHVRSPVFTSLILLDTELERKRGSQKQASLSTAQLAAQAGLQGIYFSSSDWLLLVHGWPMGRQLSQSLAISLMAH